MLAAVCYTKNRDNIIKVLNVFAKGVLNQGWDVIRIHDGDEFERGADKCQVFVSYGEWNSGNNLLRGLVHNYCQETKKPKVILDIGFLKNDRWVKNSIEGYTSVSLGCTKGYGKYLAENSPPDRFEKLKLEIKPWKKDGKHILILGQMAGGVSTRHFSIVGWYAIVYNELRKQTSLPIVLRPHPNQKILPDIPGLIIAEPNQNIKHDLNDALCVVTKTSNSGVEALLHGIPIICDDDLCMSYSMSSHTLNLQNLVYPDRQQFFNNLAYCQWNIEEIREGLPWKHFKRYLMEKSYGQQ